MENYIIPVEYIPHEEGNRLSKSLQDKGFRNIPTNVILDKTLTGIGATHGEIIDESRNSIIIQPNVPVIKGKEKDFINNERIELFTIYKGVNKPKIKAFIKRETDRKKKILTTPEGFKKLRGTFDNPDDLYKNYFCLFDECEKITQDVGYRKRISQPVYDFFKFEQKAFVSATPLEMKHPKLKDQGFKKLKIVPKYEYKEKLKLVVTNTFTETVSQELELLKESPNICIFFNSTDGISKIIQSLELVDYKVFCSEDSKKKLVVAKGITNVEPEFHLPLARYNFFTSRFYAAFDIKLKNDIPDILILTDLDSALHSMVDPMTEAIQIQGRFREKIKGKRFNSLTHITTIKENLKVFSQRQISTRIQVFKENYDLLIDKLNRAENEDKINALLEDIQGIKYKDLLDDSGSLNHFAVDNWYNEEREKAYYTNADLLYKGYEESKYFDVSLKNQIDLYHIDVLKNELENKPKVKAVIDILLERDDKQKLKFNLRQIYPDTDIVFDAFEKLGVDVIERYQYKLATIKKKLRQYESEERRFCPQILDEIYSEFEIESIIPCKEFAKKLQTIFDRYGIEKKAAQERIKDYFHCTHNKEKNTYRIICKHENIEEIKRNHLQELRSKWKKSKQAEN